MTVGEQAPRVRSVPEFHHSRIAEVREACERVKLVLDTWQDGILEGGLGVREDGRWASFEVGVPVSRQNGKGAILSARSIGGLFALEEELIIHSAHQFDTSLEAMERLLALIENCPEFDQQVKRVSRAHGQEGITLKGGRRIRFRTRTSGGGRGFSCDCLILDEAMFLKQTAHAALLPTLSARPNPQVWYTGSAVDQTVHEHGVVFAKVRERGHAKGKRLAFFEWSLPYDSPDEVPEEILKDPEAWAQANPALGIRIDPEYIDLEQSSLDARSFAVERLGVGDWPPTDSDSHVIDLVLWGDLYDRRSSVSDPVRFAVDVKPDRSKSAICVAGQRDDDLYHIEVVEHREGTGWVAQRLKDLQATHSILGPALYDGSSPAAALVPEFDDLQVEVESVTAPDHAKACGSFVDAVTQAKVRHLGTPELVQAIKGAAQRSLGDSWAWARKSSAGDISPLVGVTLALWGFREYQYDGELLEVF